ncbi:hypothetical protein [Methylobacterium trifolii]|uniref:Uncharacterized protein n=1 Tax=Methylobacterium trifolii TaxID=1003092 RepID=A0ABQ4U0A6_9HYPH|nr:hypothetical protein [Methylobacterium trifolii]GJE60910.1 hypothetical protein MPOCJGCO_3029 [Methylobacterium trifolii]
MAEAANYLDVQRALQENTAGIIEQIPVSALHLSMPVDGRGARIHASVKAGEKARVPSHVDVELDGRALSIPVEAVADYSEFKAY